MKRTKIFLCLTFGIPEATLIAGLASAAAQGGQAAATSSMNRKTREWSEEMYGRQLVDNRNLWNEQNRYNSPAAQMQRFKEAGLSPHLIYGKGAGSSDAGPIQKPDIQRPQFDTPDIASIGQTVGSTVSQYYNLEQVAAQTNNLAQQEKNMKAQETNTIIEGYQKMLDYSIDKKYKDTSVKTNLERNLMAQVSDQYDNILRSNLFAQEQETQGALYLQQMNKAVMENWDHIQTFNVMQENKNLHKLFIQSGMSEGVAQAVLTQAKADLANQEAKFYTPQLILGAIQKVVSMVPGLGNVAKQIGDFQRNKKGQPKEKTHRSGYSDKSGHYEETSYKY